MDKEHIADEKFPSDLTTKERAVFEVGIKLGALYHIAMGIPISKNPETIESIETALENSIKSQPYITEVEVLINQEKIRGDKSHEFDYSQINSTILEAEIKLQYKDVHVTGVLEWNEELEYPLMYIKEAH